MCVHMCVSLLSKMRIFVVIIMAMLAIGSAFLPKVIVQKTAAPLPATTQTAQTTISTMSADFAELDNIFIKADSAINPARKCGFCMG